MAKEGMMKGGHLYTQTNEIENAIIHYQRRANGILTEMERVRTGGAGSGEFKPISGQESAPNAFEGASSIVITPDRRFLFTTNGGDNSVSSFSVGQDGKLTLLDVKPTGNPVEGRSGTAKSVSYRPSSKTLYVLHSFGPDHVRLMSVSADGKLTQRPERHTINTHDKTNRVSTMVVLSPNEKFLFVGTTFDEPIVTTGLYPDGSPILGSSGRAARTTPSPPMPRIPMVSSFFPYARTVPSALAGLLTEKAARRSISPSCTVGRTPSSSDMQSAMV